MQKIKLAIAGVGNCASALVQGLEYYKNIDDDDPGLGLMHNVFGGYRIKDIKIVAAFDVDETKVGKDISQAIFSGNNCTIKFCDVKKMGIEVHPAPVLDGLGKCLREKITSTKKPSVNVAKVLGEADAEVLINFLPVGSRKATEYYAESCLKPGVAFINAIPEFIASDKKWATKFRRANLPIAGDDIKSQLGATILHRVLAQLFVDRGIKITKSYQLNVGGNTDFYNMLQRDRLKSKRISKTEAVESLIPYDVDLQIGPSDYVKFLNDNKIAFIRIEGKEFGDVPLTLDIRLSVEDSSNSAGVAVDVIRAVKLALDRGLGGPLYSISAYYFKHPPQQYPDDVAKRIVEEFIRGDRKR